MTSDPLRPREATPATAGPGDDTFPGDSDARQLLADGSPQSPFRASHGRWLLASESNEECSQHNVKDDSRSARRPGSSRSETIQGRHERSLGEGRSPGFRIVSDREAPGR
jgi:hypothetical protein